MFMPSSKKIMSLLNDSQEEQHTAGYDTAGETNPTLSFYEISKTINVEDYEKPPITLSKHIWALYIQATPAERAIRAQELHAQNKKALPFYLTIFAILAVGTGFFYASAFYDLFALFVTFVMGCNYYLNNKEARFFTSNYEPQKKEQNKEPIPEEKYQPEEDFEKLEIKNIQTQETSADLENQLNTNNEYNRHTTYSNLSHSAEKFEIIKLEDQFESDTNNHINSADTIEIKPSKGCTII